MSTGIAWIERSDGATSDHASPEEQDEGESTRTPLYHLQMQLKVDFHVAKRLYMLFVCDQRAVQWKRQVFDQDHEHR